MGEVYPARDTRLDRDVAIKVLPPGLAATEGFFARFEREAKAISSLNHPHICALYDVGHATHDGEELRYLVLGDAGRDLPAWRTGSGALA